jgi:flagellin-like hook-associated protein FlgL
MGAPPVLQNPDPADAYRLLYDSLDDAYWEASDIQAKDLVHGVQTEVGEILDAIVHQQLATNTALFAAMGVKIQATNAGLEKIQKDIDHITRNISTAGTVLGAIGKVLALFP